MSTPVDFTIVINSVLGILATVLTVFGSRALVTLETHFKMQVSDAQNAQWDAALSKALTYAATQSTDVIKTKGWDNFATKNQVLQIALPYLVHNFPDALTNIGLTGHANDAGDTTKIRNALERQFPSAMLTASASPATPAVPAVPAVPPQVTPVIVVGNATAGAKL